MQTPITLSSIFFQNICPTKMCIFWRFMVIFGEFWRIFGDFWRIFVELVKSRQKFGKNQQKSPKIRQKSPKIRQKFAKVLQNSPKLALYFGEFLAWRVFDQILANFWRILTNFNELCRILQIFGQSSAKISKNQQNSAKFVKISC